MGVFTDSKYGRKVQLRWTLAGYQHSSVTQGIMRDLGKEA